MVDFANSEFYSANVSTLTTDFNVTPYYDDYDAKNNYYRILFKPGFAVQARELTQIQTMTQEQISRFGQHIFKEGSKVLGSRPTLEKQVPYIKVKDNDSLGNEVTLSSFQGQIVTGQTTGIKAYVNLVLEGSESSQNTKTLYVTYQSGNANTNETVFVGGETLVSNVGTLVALANSATGYGSVLSVSEGVRYAKKHFIYHDNQSLVVDRYGQTPTCKVGFYVSEDIINSTQDSSLLDPALESSNFSAPGADRLKLTPSLQRLEINEAAGPPDYVAILEVRNGVIQELADRPVYNVIADEVAKRTYDESGDYYVDGLNVQVLENLAVANNGGLFTSAEGGNSSLLSVMVEPGTAYVKGYEILNRVSNYVTTDKATTFTNVNSQISTSKLGSYLTINEAVGAWNLDTGTQIDLYNTAQKRITNKGWSTASPIGSKIGTARVKSITYDSGTLGTAAATIKLHIFDVQMLGTNAFSNVKSVYYDNASSADIGADVVLDSVDQATLQEQATALIYPVGSPSIRTIRASDGTVDTTFTFKKTSQVSIVTGGTFTVTGTIANEIFPYGTGTLSSTDKTDIFLNLNESFNIALPGTALSGGGASNTLTGSSTFFTRLNVGSKIEFSGNTQTYIIASIANNTSLSVTTTLPSINGNTIFKAYKTGDMIDMRGIGVDAGTTRTITSTPTSLAFDLKETLGGTRSATVSYSVSRTSAREIAKTLKPSRYVKINVAAAGTTAGPYNLGFSDVFKIKSVRSDTTAFTSASQGTDVTSSFTLDNGQRDNYYGHASITPTGVTLTSSNHLLVELDYFLPDFTLGVGYFSVDSYPVNDTSPSSSQITTAQIPVFKSKDYGTSYDLRNALDFRPVYTNSALDSTTVAGASTNPAAASSLYYDNVGLRMPAESKQIIFDYSYYLPRIDVVVVDITGTFSVIKGVPSTNPVTPIVPDNYMSCARIFVTPYPSISPDYGRTLLRSDLACSVRRTSNIRYTMRDIGVLKNRIDNLEQYVSLSLLEKNTLDLKILDENGLDRFKNGIFTDNFVNKALSDVTNPDWHICVDPKEFSIRPLYETQALGFVVDSNTNAVVTGDYIMLPYTETTLIEQPYATTFRNVETTVYRFVGKIFLDPEIDFWTNTQRLSTQTIQFGDSNLNFTPYAISYGAWQTVSGSTVPTSSTITGNQDILNFVNSQGGWGAFDSATVSGPGGGRVFTNIRLPNGQLWTASATDTATVTTLKYNQIRNVTETFQYLQDDSRNLGDRVTNVALISDLRPQIITFEARGLKASTRHYLYFDGQLMSSYVTPAELATISTYSTAGREIDARNYVRNGAEGDALYSDADGVLRGFLRIPSDGSKTFRVGSKEFILTDSPSNADDATSAAKSYFTSYGIQQTLQDTVLSTKRVVTELKQSSQQQTVNSTSIRIFDAVSCMAYSFIPKAPDNVEGVFLSSIDVYFANKDPNLAIWFEIRAMDNAGNITRTQVPMSEVWLSPSSINTSDDGSTATNVKFKTPIFLQNNIEYALVIHTEGINPNYYMYVCVLGETDILTKNPINQRPLTGTLYTTNNNLDWDIVPRVDLKVKFNRASFTTGVTGQAILGNEPFEFLTANTVSATLSYQGEQFNGNDTLILTTPSGGTISTTDLLIGANSGVNTSVVAINGSAYRMANTGYADGESLTVRRANGLITAITTSVSSKNTASGLLYSYNSLYNTNKVVFSSSNGKFLTGDTMRGVASYQNFVVQSIDKFTYSTIQFEPSYLTFKTTSCSFEMAPTSNTGTVGTYNNVDPSVVVDFDDEKAIFSRTNEIGTLTDRSNKVRVSMYTTTDFLSPVVDKSKTYNIYVRNLINSNTSGETAASGGGLTNKYISQIITLDENQDAEDLRVILTAYRPPGSNSNIKVYTRYTHAEDFESIRNRNWIEMSYYDDSVYSSLTDRKNFREYTFNLPSSVLTGSIGSTANVAQYTNSVGTTFTGFRQYQIKIGLQSDNSAVVPRGADLRVIALQK